MQQSPKKTTHNKNSFKFEGIFIMKKIAIFRIDYKQTADSKIFILEIDNAVSSSINGAAINRVEFNKLIISRLLSILQGKKLYLTNAVNNEVEISYSSLE